MDLYEYLYQSAVSDHCFLSIIGGGGKTTLMIRFARYLKNQGKKVLITTTTKVRSPYLQFYGQDRVYSDQSVLSHFPDGPETVFYAYEPADTTKWTCPSLEDLRILKDRYDVILNEADGSKMRPVKVHTQRDPVVPDFTTYTISVLGLWALGKNTKDVAFGEERNLVVDSSYVSWIVHDPEGLLKRSLPGHRAIIFNGADDNGYDAIRYVDYPKDVTVLAASVDKGVLYEKIQ